MKLSKFVASVGENPAFVAFNAHCWFAFSIVTLSIRFLPILLVVTCAIILAGAKEYWFDLKFETTPIQTILDSTEDFIGYAVGIALALLASNF